MPRPTRLDEQRRELLPVLTTAFGDLGFRRATTAELARRCGVRENILYRHWDDKAAMFVAALDHVHDLATATWTRVLQGEAPSTAGAAVERLLDYEAEHLGEFGNYRIIFSALGEADDPEIARALKRMYRGFFAIVHGSVTEARKARERAPSADLSAWAVIGLGTVATIVQELGLVSKRRRKQLMSDVGRFLVNGRRE